MKVKVSEATPVQINWMVAKCETLSGNAKGFELRFGTPFLLDGYWDECRASTDWAQGGPIIERGGIAISPHDTLGWAAFQSHTAIDGVIYKDYFGPTPLIAAMRCYVASKLGDTVDVPDELNP